MKVLITLLGRSVWGLVNSAWASIREFDYIPDRVHIVAARKQRMDAEIAGKLLEVVLRNHGSPAEIHVEIVEGGDVGAVASKVRELVTGAKMSGHSIAVDVTSGTKDLVLGSLMVELEKVDHIFYLRLDSLRNADRPYMLIPVERQHALDVLREVR